MPDIEITEEILRGLSNRILHEEDRSMFEDVAKTIRAKANRSAYIMIWITCAESLKRRLQWASDRDSQAGKLLGKIEEAEEKHHAVDSMLVDSCKIIGVISDVESTRLMQIYENRNLYGHPYNMAPDQASILSAVNIVVDAVLSKENKLRHAYAEERLKYLTQDKTYLEDDATKIQNYATHVADRMDQKVHRFFILKYYEFIHKIWGDPEQQLFKRRGLLFCKAFLEHVGPNTIFREDEWHDLMARMSNLISWLAGWKSVFVCLNDVAKDEAVLKNIELSNGNPHRLNRLYTLLFEGLLSESQQAHLREKCRLLSTYEFGQTEIPLTYVIDEVLTRLNSMEYNRANSGATILFWTRIGELALLSTEYQDKVGDRLADAALMNAFDAVSAVRRIATTEIDVPYDLKLGYCKYFFTSQVQRVLQRKNLYGNSIAILRSLKADDQMLIDANFRICLQQDESIKDIMSSDEGKAFLDVYESSMSPPF